MPWHVAIRTAPVFAFALLASPLAFGQSCQDLDGLQFKQDDLYAITRTDRTVKKTLLSSLPFAQNKLDFDDRLKLVYVLDQPLSRPQLFAVKRDFAGVLAVRLVSTSVDGKPRPPSTVYLKKDRIVTRKARKGWRPAWHGEVSATRYYIYHNPKEIRASDSLLERKFHTSYQYRTGESERNTYEDRERRGKFHFPEMTAETPVGGFVGFIAGIFGGGSALADGTESRFESQIKYYQRAADRPRDPEPRCVQIETRLGKADNNQLKITISDLDYPNAPFDASETWTINWVRPKPPTSN